MLPFLQRALHLPFRLALGDRLPLVVLTFAARDGQLYFRPAALQIHQSGDYGHAPFTDAADDAGNFAFV